MFRWAEAATVLLLALPTAATDGRATPTDPDGLRESSARLRLDASAPALRATSLLPMPHGLSRRSSASTDIVYFAFGLSVIRWDEAAQLEAFTDRLPAGATVVVDGHADRIGTDDANVRLARARARRVTKSLRLLGFDVVREVFGERCPATRVPHPRRWDRRVTVSLRPPTPVDLPCPPR